MALIIESGFASSTEGADEFITDDVVVTGAVHWVDSVTGSDSNAGTEGKPLATLAQAITNATANNGDIIIVKSGHTETLASSISINKAGLKIFGIGNGSAAPNFTCAFAGDALNITGAGVEVNNLYFPAGTVATNTARINVDAANVRIKGCTFKCGAFDQDTITLTANALYAKLESNAMTVTAAGPRYGVSIESAAAVALFMKDCAYDGGTANWSVAAVYSNVAHLNWHYERITLTDQASIQHANSGNKGWFSAPIADDGSTVQA
jgi:hypothetical protein